MGTKMWGNWSKEKNLGSGSFGVVTLWKNQINGQLIAIKLFTDEIDGGGARIKSKNRERWAKEVEIMKKLLHPNIIKVLPTPEDLMSLAFKLPILCMEYCTHGDLRKVLNRPENCSGLKENQVRILMKNIKDGVEYLHKEKIIHRDIKPENIVLQSSNEDDNIVYKLIDLGYGKELENSKNYPSIVATLQYVAPEISSHDYTCSVDYWSLGIVFHEVITGIRPFLPNMTPLSWFPIVKKKSKEDIYVYQNLEGNIEYSKEIPRENNLSWFLRDEIEKWLRYALDYDGNKRGKFNNDIIIFKLLDHILEKKIVTVFSTVLFEQLSYEIDNSTAISTLMRWIERDTKHEIEDQLLLMPTGDELKPNCLAMSCWDATNEIAMVYVLDKNEPLLPKNEPNIPKLVSEMLKEPKKLRGYYILKRMWSNSIYLIQRQIYLCETLAEAWAVKLLSILNKIKELIMIDNQIESGIHLCSGKLILHNSSIDYNEKYFNKILNQKDISDKKLEEWRQESIEFEDTLSTYTESWKKLNITLNEIRIKFDSCQSFCEECPKKVEDLKKILKGAHKLYENLQKMPQELRNSESNCVEMSAFINKSLEIRDDIINLNNSTDDFEYLKYCENSSLSIKQDYLNLEQNMNILNRDVVKAHLLQFKDIWLLFDEYVNIKPTVNVKTSQISRTSSETSINNFLTTNNFPNAMEILLPKQELKEISLDDKPNQDLITEEMMDIINGKKIFSHSTEV